MTAALLDALEADRTHLARLGDVSDERAAVLTFAFGPIEVDWATFVAFR